MRLVRDWHWSPLIRKLRLYAFNYCQAISMEDLAAQARMGTSTLHHHFRSLTALSRSQYQKELRLQEGRRLMLAERIDSANTAFTMATRASPSSAVSTTACLVLRRYEMFLYYVIFRKKNTLATPARGVFLCPKSTNERRWTHVTHAEIVSCLSRLIDKPTSDVP
jgi:AcrR family transcriptional regulator